MVQSTAYKKPTLNKKIQIVLKQKNGKIYIVNTKESWSSYFNIWQSGYQNKENFQWYRGTLHTDKWMNSTGREK